MKYIDADKLIAEIEQRIRIIENCPFIEPELGAQKVAGEIIAYKDILRFIDSLPDEPKPSEGLEGEIQKYLKPIIYGYEASYSIPVTKEQLEDLTRHFAEWGATHVKK